MDKNKKLIVIISVCVVLLFLVTVAALSKNADIGESSLADESVEAAAEAEASAAADEEKLIGTWVYDDGTEYRFAQDGTGGMTVGSYEYKFTYDTSDNNLKILYDNSEVHDSEYTYSLEGDKLKLIGGEGTAGGEYYLEKAN